jgi:hypothetical protein
MKTQVIQLDTHDDVTSVRDKMSWAKTERILLVFPRRSRVLHRPLDLRLLDRHAAALGARLAIVGRSGALGAAARAVGIPVFETAAAAKRGSWPEPPAPAGLHERPRQPEARRPDLLRRRDELMRREPAWQSRPAVRLGFFVLALLAILALLATFLPSAAIELTPQTSQQDITFTIISRPDLAAVTLAGEIPARLTSAFADGNRTIPVSGSVSVPDAAAAGSVRFRNLSDEPVAIIGGTVVATQAGGANSAASVRFATLVDVVMPAGVGKVLDVEVRAVQPGSSGNLPADALVAIEGDLGTRLSVTNPAPTAGGTDRLAPTQTAEDRASLRSELLGELLHQCELALPATLESGDRIFPQTLELAQVLSETYVPAENQTGEMLSLTMNLQCRAQFASAADLAALAGLILDADLPAGFVPGSEQAAITHLGSPVTDASEATSWEATASRPLRSRLDRQPAAQLAAGGTPVDAARRLADSLPLAAAPVIRLVPAWWPWMPLIPFRISVQVRD